MFESSAQISATPHTAQYDHPHQSLGRIHHKNRQITTPAIYSRAQGVGGWETENEVVVAELQGLSQNGKSISIWLKLAHIYIMSIYMSKLHN